MVREGSLRIGLDFDNTIACYDAVFARAAKEAGLVPAGFDGDKAQLRARLRAAPDGEVAWQRLQGRVYGRLMEQATLMVGAGDFLRRCRRAGIGLFIVSHKTEFGHFDPDRVPLRPAALAWMERLGFFAADGFAIPRDHVFFEATRRAKLARIGGLSCDAFVDDLVEVLDDPDFPPGIARHLLGPPGTGTQALTARTWGELADALLPP